MANDWKHISHDPVSIWCLHSIYGKIGLAKFRRKLADKGDHRMATQEETKMAVERTIRAMRLRPSIARYKIHSSARVGNTLKCAYTEGDWHLELDVPKAVGGDGIAPSPGVFSRAALTGCVAIGIKM